MNLVSVVRDSVDPLGPLGLDQSGLAAALNVTQPAVSQWISGRRAPTGEVVETLERAWQTQGVARVEIGRDSRGLRIFAPASRWEPVYRPRDRFRLPLHLEWSGTGASRWRSARDPTQLLMAYALVLDCGSATDVALWVDPEILAEFWPLVPMARSRRGPWERHLTELGYRVTNAAE